MTIAIRTESTHDREGIRGVNQSAFGEDTEADLVDALRDGEFAEVSLVAELEGILVGHILFSRVTITSNGETVDAVSLAPMAVTRAHQRQGIGSKLVTAGLEACRKRGHRIAVVLGHPDFYPRFGFSAEMARPLESLFGGGDAWMAVELVPGALTGVEGKVEYAAPFRAFE